MKLLLFLSLFLTLTSLSIDYILPTTKQFCEKNVFLSNVPQPFDNANETRCNQEFPQSQYKSKPILARSIFWILESIFEDKDVISKENLYRLQKLFRKLNSGQNCSIYILGGSFTAGRHVGGYDGAYGAKLENSLNSLPQYRNSPNRVKIINKAVGGTDSFWALQRINHPSMIPHDEFVDLVIVDYDVNDCAMITWKGKKSVDILRSTPFLNSSLNNNSTFSSTKTPLETCRQLLGDRDQDQDGSRDQRERTQALTEALIRALMQPKRISSTPIDSFTSSSSSPTTSVPALLFLNIAINHNHFSPLRGDCTMFHSCYSIGEIKKPILDAYSVPLLSQKLALWPHFSCPIPPSITFPTTPPTKVGFWPCPRFCSHPGSAAHQWVADILSGFLTGESFRHLQSILKENASKTNHSTSTLWTLSSSLKASSNKPFINLFPPDSSISTPSSLSHDLDSVCSPNSLLSRLARQGDFSMSPSSSHTSSSLTSSSPLPSSPSDIFELKIKSYYFGSRNTSITLEEEEDVKSQNVSLPPSLHPLLPSLIERVCDLPLASLEPSSHFSFLLSYLESSLRSSYQSFLSQHHSSDESVSSSSLKHQFFLSFFTPPPPPPISSLSHSSSDTSSFASPSSSPSHSHSSQHFHRQQPQQQHQQQQHQQHAVHHHFYHQHHLLSLLNIYHQHHHHPLQEPQNQNHHQQDQHPFQFSFTLNDFFRFFSTHLHRSISDISPSFSFEGNISDISSSSSSSSSFNSFTSFSKQITFPFPFPPLNPLILSSKSTVHIPLTLLNLSRSSLSIPPLPPSVSSFDSLSFFLPSSSYISPNSSDSSSFSSSYHNFISPFSSSTSSSSSSSSTSSSYSSCWEFKEDVNGKPGWINDGGRGEGQEKGQGGNGGEDMNKHEGNEELSKNLHFSSSLNSNRMNSSIMMLKCAFDGLFPSSSHDSFTPFLLSPEDDPQSLVLSIHFGSYPILNIEYLSSYESWFGMISIEIQEETSNTTPTTTTPSSSSSSLIPWIRLGYIDSLRDGGEWGHFSTSEVYSFLGHPDPSHTADSPNENHVSSKTHMKPNTSYRLRMRLVDVNIQEILESSLSSSSLPSSSTTTVDKKWIPAPWVKENNQPKLSRPYPMKFKLLSVSTC